MKPAHKKSMSWTSLKPVPGNNQDDLSLFKSLVFNRHTLSWIIGPDDTLVFANPAFLRLFGLNDSAIHKKIHLILPKKIVKAFVGNHRSVCTKRTDFVTTKQSIKHNGKAQQYYVNIYPVTDHGGVTMAAGEAWKARPKRTANSNGHIKKLEDQLEEVRMQHQRELSRMITEIQEKERHLMSHELHDNINQLLAVSRIFLETIHITDADNQLLKSKALDSLDTAIQEIRKLTKQKTTPQLKENGLRASVRSLVRDMNCSCQFRLVFAHCNDNLEDLAEEKKIMLYRIVQEQMNNIIKHSKAKNVTIGLTLISDIVELTIKDDGVGFDTRTVQNGVGLPGIFERVENYHGRVSLKSSPGRGCSLIVHVPFP